MVKDDLDFDDGFWWIEDLVNLFLFNLMLVLFGKEFVDCFLLVLIVLVVSWNMSGIYNFW